MQTKMSHTVISATLFIVLLSSAFVGGDVGKVGNPIVDGRGTELAKTAYIVDIDFEEGVVFAFSAYFENLNLVKFQIWRPVNSSISLYQLRHQWEYSAIKENRREDVYLAQTSSKCLKVQKTDRLGIYIPQVPGPVANDFSVTNPNTYQVTFDDGVSVPEPGDTTRFDALAWPHELSIAAYVDTDLSKYAATDLVDCPRDVTFPPETDGYEDGGTTPFVPKAGATGATGPEGPVGATGSTGPRGDVGASGELGATGYTGQGGPKGDQGSKGEQGNIGPVGPSGSAGATGQEGPQGDRGLRGPPGAANNVSTPVRAATFEELVSGCDWCSKFLNPYLILGIIIWLVLVTLLLLITLIIVTCRKHKSKDSHYHSNLKRNSDLWKKYENGGFDPAEPDVNYDSIPEGRTAF